MMPWYAELVDATKDKANQDMEIPVKEMMGYVEN